MATLLSLLAEASLLGLASLHPTGLPMYLVDMNDREAGEISKPRRQRAFAGPGLTHDHDALNGHVWALRRNSAEAQLSATGDRY